MPVANIKEAKFDLEKSSALSKAQKAKSELKENAFVSRGVGDIKDSMSSFGDNIQENYAKFYGLFEKNNSATLKVRLQQLQKKSNLMLETEREISDVLKNLNDTKKTQPLLDSAKKIAETLSASASAVMGFELLSVGAPVVGSVFLISATLSGAKLSGFLKEYKDSLEKLNLASSIAAIASANYANAIAQTTPKMINSAIFLLNSVVDAGTSFNKREQTEYKAQYLDLQEGQQKIDFILGNLLKKIEQSFEKDEQILRNIKHQILANTNLD